MQQLSGFLPLSISQLFAYMGGCFGCCGKSSSIVKDDNPRKEVANQERMVRKKSAPHEFWNSSMSDMDNSIFQSPGTLSSTSNLNQPLDTSSDSVTTTDTSAFVNHGLRLWNKTRQQWIGNKSSQKQTGVREPEISPDATYETLLGTNKPFPRPVPLAEMVDFLVECWEQEGLYD